LASQLFHFRIFDLSIIINKNTVN